MSGAETTYTKLDPADPERFKSLRRELGVQTFGINQMILRPGERGRVHLHTKQEEVYIVISGVLTLELGKRDHHELRAGELVRVPEGVKRRVANYHDVDAVLIALGGLGEVHSGRDGVAWAEWDTPGDGAAPQEVALPDDLPGSALRRAL